MWVARKGFQQELRHTGGGNGEMAMWTRHGQPTVMALSLKLDSQAQSSMIH